MIKNKRSYKTLNGVLIMTVIKIHHENEDVVKFKGILSNKINGIIYETKNYELPKERIKHWLDITDKV
jgi:hypothetical protein